MAPQLSRASRIETKNLLRDLWEKNSLLATGEMFTA